MFKIEHMCPLEARFSSTLPAQPFNRANYPLVLTLEIFEAVTVCFLLLCNLGLFLVGGLCVLFGKLCVFFLHRGDIFPHRAGELEIFRRNHFDSVHG